MDGDLIYDVTKVLKDAPVKESIEARRRGGVTIRRWDKEARIDVHRGFDRLPDSWDVDIVEYTMQLATLLRSVGYRIIVSELDEYHGVLRTYTPPADAWRPQ